MTRFEYKEYTVADLIAHDKRSRQTIARTKEDDIMEEAYEKMKRLTSTGYFMSSNEKKKQMRAEAKTVPLTAFVK